MKQISFKDVQINQRFKHANDGRWNVKKSATTYLKQVGGLFGYAFCSTQRIKSLSTRIESEDSLVFVDKTDHDWSKAPTYWHDAVDPDALPDFTGKLRETMG